MNPTAREGPLPWEWAWCTVIYPRPGPLPARATLRPSFPVIYLRVRRPLASSALPPVLLAPIPLLRRLRPRTRAVGLSLYRMWATSGGYLPPSIPYVDRTQIPYNFTI